MGNPLAPPPPHNRERRYSSLSTERVLPITGLIKEIVKHGPMTRDKASWNAFHIRKTKIYRFVEICWGVFEYSVGCV
jgi:hypothetical protein